jgi:uncharacterized protein YmfQ (DUF2313 family)
VKMATKYAKTLWSLFPPGVVWAFFAGKLDALIEAIAENFQDIHDRLTDLLKEMHPRTATETIAEWEKSYGLSTDESKPLATRQDTVVAKRKKQRVRPADYILLIAPMVGVDPSSLVFIEHTSDSSVAALRPRMVFTGHVYRNPALGPVDLTSAQEILNVRRHAHTQIDVIESIDFKSDDTHSLTDRDLISGGGTYFTPSTFGGFPVSYLLREDSGHILREDSGAIIRE